MSVLEHTVQIATNQALECVEWRKTKIFLDLRVAEKPISRNYDIPGIATRHTPAWKTHLAIRTKAYLGSSLATINRYH
jgi:hypothetical protein